MITYGSGIVNHILNKLPIELHIPGYQFCGPGTNLQKRLARGDSGVNLLDSACKEHDIAYSENRENIEKRNAADKMLADKAWQRVLAKDSSLGEKSAAYAVANIMNAKTKLGMGRKTQTQKAAKGRRRVKKGKMINFKAIINAAKKNLNRKSRNGRVVIKSALLGARKMIKKRGGKKNSKSAKY